MPVYYNCHSHSFNYAHVPEYFLAFKLPGRFVAKAAAALINAPLIGKGLLKVMSVAPTTKKYADFLAVGKTKTQDLIFEMLKAKYPSGTRIVVLPLNFDYMGAGSVKVSYVQQLSELIDLKKKYPDECLPFVCIDPRMGTAEANRDFVKKYIDIGFSGIKMYPSLGYYPFDPRMKLVYEYAEDNQVPILTHCSRGGIHYVAKGKTIPADFLDPATLNPLDPPPHIDTSLPKMGDFKNNFIQTASYLDVLKTFPDLKLCFAHFGADDDNPYPPGKDNLQGANDWYHQIIGLMGVYKNVYTDISYSLTQPAFMTGFYNDYLKMPVNIKNRILYGTDFYMIEQEVQNDDHQIFNAVKKLIGQVEFDKLASENVETFLQMKAPPVI